MKNQVSNSSKNSYLQYLAYLPVPFFLLLIFMLVIFQFGVVWNPVFLFSALNIIFLSIIMFFVSILSVRSYLADHSLVILLLGSGTLALGIGALLAGLAILENTVNTTVTIYNTMACVSSVFIIFSAVSTIKFHSKRLKSIWPLFISYLSVFLLITVLAFLVLSHIWPVYFIQGIGPTITDLVVLYVTIALFAFSAIILLIGNLRYNLKFYRIYGLGFGLIAIGLIGVSVQTSIGDPLNWVGRISQYLGAVYILIAILLSFRESGVWLLPWKQALYKSEEKYRNLFMNMTEEVHVWKIVHDREGHIKTWRLVDINPPGLKTWDKSLDEIKWKTTDEIFGPGATEHYLPVVQKIINEGIPYSYEDYFPHLDKYFRFTSVPMGDYFITTGSDITEIKKSQKELQDSNKELMQTQEELKETVNKLKISNQELEQFAYVASHDLQEPLRMVGSFTQLLEMKYKDKLDNDANDYIGYIVEGSHRMKNLIDDLLAFSRLNTEKKEFQLKNLNQVLDNVMLGMKSSIEEEDAHITSDNLPTVKCDSSQISQVFQNLISNSIKFHNSPPTIHISAEESDGEWILGVSDEGIGIDPKHQKKIFDVFNRLHTREEYAGTGIGLSICKRIVERHNGRIWVESEPGQGANFYFTIPKTEM
jgi:signal transduction histidine kinase